jgi:hypothetical protein
MVLRVWVVVPATIALVAVGGLVFTLAPGPLCDEGMILFMEGGCDWGASNIFFFSKLGLLLALNIVFSVAWRSRVCQPMGFLPHLLVLGCLVVAERSGGDCDTYYSHPNGSIGQMVLECIGFALVGMSILVHAERRTWPRLFAILAFWNALYVGVFYTGLMFTHHWTWLHTAFIFSCLATVAVVIALLSEARSTSAARM